MCVCVCVCVCDLSMNSLYVTSIFKPVQTFVLKQFIGFQYC